MKKHSRTSRDEFSKDTFSLGIVDSQVISVSVSSLEGFDE